MEFGPKEVKCAMKKVTAGPVQAVHADVESPATHAMPGSLRTCGTNTRPRRRVPRHIALTRTKPNHTELRLPKVV